MSYLKFWDSKLSKVLSHVMEAIFSGLFYVAAFGCCSGLMRGGSEF